MNTNISGLFKVFLDHRVRLFNWAGSGRAMSFVLSLKGLRGANQEK